MAAITMAPGSQPASMPAESNRFQQTPLTSTARSFTAEIDPSWEIRALSAEPGSTLACNGASALAPLCANPHTPVCTPPQELSPVPTAETLADAAIARRLASERARKKKARAKKTEAKRLSAIVAAAGEAGREMCKAQAERDELRS